MCLERQVIEYCSPTLAGLKTGSLFNCRYESDRELEEAVEDLNLTLNKKDVYFQIMRKSKGRALIYVYRSKKLEEALTAKDTEELLAAMGYVGCRAFEAIEKLRQNFMCNKDFPHEIGVFLGYPPGDVMGFIKNKGKNAKFTGCWKVYSNVEDAKRQFGKFKKCRDTYVKLRETGRDIEKLTVCA